MSELAKQTRQQQSKGGKILWDSYPECWGYNSYIEAALISSIAERIWLSLFLKSLKYAHYPKCPKIDKTFQNYRCHLERNFSRKTHCVFSILRNVERYPSVYFIRWIVIKHHVNNKAWCDWTILIIVSVHSTDNAWWNIAWTVLSVKRRRQLFSK